MIHPIPLTPFFALVFLLDYSWLQRGDCYVQKREIQRMGRRRTRQDSAFVETLLHWHAGARLRCRQPGPGTYRRGKAGTSPNIE